MRRWVGYGTGAELAHWRIEDLARSTTLDADVNEIHLVGSERFAEREERCKEALGLFRKAVRAGFVPSVVNGRLALQTPAGGDPDLRDRLLEVMQPIMPLFLMRDRLLALARSIDVPREVVMRIPAAWLEDLVDDYSEWERRKSEGGYPAGQRYLVSYLLRFAKFDATGKI